MLLKQRKQPVTKTPLTIEKLKQFKGCENAGEQEAEEIIATLDKLARICFEFYSQNKLNNEKP